MKPKEAQKDLDRQEKIKKRENYGYSITRLTC